MVRCPDRGVCRWPRRGLPEVRAELPGDAPQGLCPACLLGVGLGDEPTSVDGRSGATTSCAGSDPARRRDGRPRPCGRRAGIRPGRDRRRPIADRIGRARRGGWPPPGTRPLLRRLRAAGGDRPRRHGRRLQGPAGQPQPRRRAEDDPGRPARLARPTCSASAPRRRRRPTSTTRTSCRSTRSASTRASTTSRMKLVEGGSLAAAARRLAADPPARRPRLVGDGGPGGPPRPPARASCTAT